MLMKDEKPKAGDNVSAEEELRKTIDNELDTAVEAALSDEHPSLLAKYEKVRQVTDYGVRHEDKPAESTAQPQ